MALVLSKGYLKDSSSNEILNWNKLASSYNYTVFYSDSLTVIPYYDSAYETIVMGQWWGPTDTYQGKGSILLGTPHSHYGSQVITQDDLYGGGIYQNYNGAVTIVHWGDGFQQTTSYAYPSFCTSLNASYHIQYFFGTAYMPNYNGSDISNSLLYANSISGIKNALQNGTFSVCNCYDGYFTLHASGYNNNIESVPSQSTSGAKFAMPGVLGSYFYGYIASNKTGLQNYSLYLYVGQRYRSYSFDITYLGYDNVSAGYSSGHDLSDGNRFGYIYKFSGIVPSVVVNSYRNGTLYIYGIC